MVFHNKILTICAVLLSAVFTAMCSMDASTYDRKTFDYDLRGTWASNDPDSRYSGTLAITYDRITIAGYSENQTPAQGGNDTERPFRNITKSIALKGYSEGGRIFIEDGGLVQEGIPYIYWYDSPPPSYKRVEFLRFTFGGRQETLRKNN